jgi:HEPN domain-containing protein
VVEPGAQQPAARVRTSSAVEARYPSVAREVTEEQYAEAVAIAEMVVRWAESIILAANQRQDATP